MLPGWLLRRVRCDISVVRLFSASAEPMVSQLTTMTPHETGRVSLWTSRMIVGDGRLTVKRANRQTNPAQLSAVHDVELRHVGDCREHDQRAANETFPQQNLDVRVHRGLETGSLKRTLQLGLPLASFLLDFARELVTKPCARLEQAMEVQHRTEKPEE